MKDNQNIDKAMEDVAYTPTKSALDTAGNPTSVVLELDEILQSEPRYEWCDIQYRGDIRAIQVMKGQIIDFYGTLDDADLLLLAPVYDQRTPDDDTETDDTADDRSFMESVEYARALKFNNDFILWTFIKGVSKENLDQIPDDLRKQMLQAYDQVNGISITNKAVSRFPPEDGE